MRFVVSPFRKQLLAERVLVNEHPARATAWQLDMLKKRVEDVDVSIAEADRCMFGLKARGSSPSQIIPARKPIQIMTICESSRQGSGQ